MGWRSSDEEANLLKRGYKGIHMCQLWNHKDELNRHVEAEQGYSKNSRILHGNKDLMDIREKCIRILYIQKVRKGTVCAVEEGYRGEHSCF